MLINRFFFILTFCILLNSCGNVDKEHQIEAIKTAYEVTAFDYDSLTIPLFFKALIDNHRKDFVLLDSSTFKDFCTTNTCNPTDSSTIEQYFTLSILHELFTSQSAANCSRGKILNIPYQWHWVKPNPRHEIYFTTTNSLLNSIKPPAEFARYDSYADIDRTPYLFLSDLADSELKYYSNACDSFSTFGWCSEREMAFVALATLLGFNGKVIAKGNHSWSEFIVNLKLTSGKKQRFKCTVDNTFDTIQWETIDKKEHEEWEYYVGDSKLAKWYNTKANSQKELRRIKNHKMSDKAMARIEHALVAFLNEK